LICQLAKSPIRSNIGNSFKGLIPGQSHAWAVAARISITMGVSVCSPHTSRDGCIKMVDEALYRGKTGGRNRVDITLAAVPGA
jgi:GGDEF domain-containing protein